MRLQCKVKETFRPKEVSFRERIVISPLLFYLRARRLFHYYRFQYDVFMQRLYVTILK